ncbi:MAG TPA: VOC family protein [Aestuariivirgaceae bacterium]
MQVQSYLIFNGRCEEAIEFYKKTLGAKVEMLMRFSDNPEQPTEQSSTGCAQIGDPNKIMHSSFRIGDTVIMASDGMMDGTTEFKGFSLTLNPTNEADARRLFAALSDGGQVQQPLISTFFSPCFGILADKFGMGWMIVVDQAAAKAA